MNKSKNEIMYKFYLKYLLFVTVCNTYAQSLENYKSSQHPSSFRRNFKPIDLVHWHWECEPLLQRCVRYNPKVSKNKNSNDSINTFHFLEGCKSVCGQFGSLWPKPTGETFIKAELKSFNIEDIAVKFDPVEKDETLDETLTEAWSIFSQYLALKSNIQEHRAKNLPKIESKRAHLILKISVKSKSLEIDLKTDESYSLSINTRVQGKLHVL